MITVNIGNVEVELKTKLGVAVAIEQNFGKKPLTTIMSQLGNAEIEELVEIIAIGAGKKNDTTFKNLVLENWDYVDLQSTAQELIANIMYGGTPEQQEAKIASTNMPDTAKNAIRKILKLNTVSSETENS